LFENAIARRIYNLHTESAFKILAKAKALEAEGRSIIHLEIGQPDFKRPENIVDAAFRAINEGYTGYSPTPGFPRCGRPLRSTPEI
jgi:aspartate/methionine/tyrosine aminotransferase